MYIRTKILPRTIQDALVTLFTILIIPTVYYFEIFIVLPKYFQPWTGWYLFHIICGTFLFFNITSNYLTVILCDTSIKGRVLQANSSKNWKLCAVCETITPPRSWHCNTCNICVLKRDHHCMFTSCCIGHCNQRYFIYFVIYIFIATIYSSFYNIYYVFEFADFGSFQSIIKLIFPLATLFVDFTSKQMYIFLTLIILITCVFTAVLLVFHFNLIARGTVTHERNQKLSEYDLGKNLNYIQVFGERWYLTWISPFIESKLPSDGINWITNQSSKAK